MSVGNAVSDNIIAVPDTGYRQRVVAPATIIDFPVLKRINGSDDSKACSNVLPLFLILTLLQVLDGTLTISGVQRFGSGIEGNPLLHYLMQSFDATALIILVKAAAICVIWLLYTVHSRISWVIPSLQIVGIIYLAAAIIPWSVILFNASS